jgi:predicted small metal-binding protein
MSTTTYKVTCSPECGFVVQSHLKDEVVAMAKEHGKKIHQLDMPNADIEKMVEAVTK